MRTLPACLLLALAHTAPAAVAAPASAQKLADDEREAILREAGGVK